MKSKKTAIAALAAVIVIGLAIYLLFVKGAGKAIVVAGAISAQVQTSTQSASHDLPPVGEPLVSTYSDLLAKAKLNDPAASKRLFDDVRECMQAARLDETFQRLSKDKDWIVNNPDALGKGGASSAQNREHILSQIEAGMARTQQAGQLCAGAPKELDDGRIYDMALGAARTGDTQAIACLLVAPYKAPQLTQDQGEAYAKEVMSMGNSSMQQGDWGIALAMTSVYSGTALGGYSNFITTIDQKKQLAYSELIRLGTPDGSPDAAHLDRRLSLLSDTLSEQDQLEAKSWAEQTYKKYYFYSGPVFPDSPACDF